MYVFGDSLVDVGNNNYLPLPGARADFPHNAVDFPTGEATGRFSIGKNAVDFLAEKVGLPSAPVFCQGEVVTKKWTRRKSDFKDGQIDTEFQEQRLPDSNLDEVVKKWTRKKTDGKEAEMGFRDPERSNILRKSFVKKPSRKSGNDSLDDVEIERAAFKSLEEFPDVCDQLRVSRVDMDERIQKLAKSLNGASIDTPEWNFSKMMKSAKIRFADFSIIRLIQILGNYGNWRQVLQVIEWMQARERFKSNRIRNIYTAALDALGKARRPVEALNMFNTMQQQMASYPDVVAYHCIAVTLGQAGHMRELFHVMIDSMRSPPKKKLATGVLQKWDPRLEPDIIVYNAALDKSCKDVLKSKSLFGGKVVVFGGDFRHILPVIQKGSRQQIVNATLCSSYI